MLQLSTCRKELSQREVAIAVEVEGDLDEGGAIWSLRSVIHDGPASHAYQALDPGVRWHAPAPQPLHILAHGCYTLFVHSGSSSALQGGPQG